jgi:hypothetical protein
MPEEAPGPFWRRKGRGKRPGTGRAGYVTGADIDEILARADVEGPIPGPEDAATEVPPRPPEGLTLAEQARLRQVLAELAGRRREALRLYQPMPLQDAFHASNAGERVIRGGNRGGKTLAAAVEVARALTGQDPHRKYPRTDGRCIAVGKDLLHCSKVMYRKLFRKGAFKVIRDLGTGRWRAVLPVVDDDRIDEAREAPPLIPSRFYDRRKISWENKKEGIPKTIPMKNGWEITFFSSIGEPMQGWDADLAWFDEEIEHPAWYPETQARLIDRRKFDAAAGKVVGGKFIWSATPQAGTQVLYDLSNRAAECKDEPNPPIEEFHVTLLGNTYLTQEAKDEFIAKFAGNEDEIRIRVHGDFALLGMRVYPEFMPKGAHGRAAFPIPDDWTRYIAVDPGRQVCAILFAAVPPPGSPLAGKIVLYDELYIKKCSAKKFAEGLKAKLAVQDIQAAIIDHRAGRVTEIGSGRTVEEQYSAALKEAGVKFVRTGHAFTWGSDDVSGGIEAVRQGLAIVDGESAKWIVLWERLPNLIWEAERYSYKKHGPTGVVQDEPIKLNDHLMDCWRYLAMAGLKYVRPKTRATRRGYTAEALRAKKEREAHRRMRGAEHGESIRVG